MKSSDSSNNNEFIVFGSPLIGKPEIDDVVESLQNGWIGTGPKTAEFEKAFASLKGVPQAVALNSCTAALHLALVASGVSDGDEIITTPLTFCATVNAIIHAGGTPVMADVDPVSMNIDPTETEKHINPRTKGILPVHLAGRPCNMEAICRIAKQHNLFVVEDCAHAIEAEYKGMQAGSIGDFGCFSFYVTKNITCGEGGMIIGRDQDKLARIKTLALHGMSTDAWHRFGDSGYKHYLVEEAGYKYNMPDINAAIGRQQIKHIQEYWLKREAIWNKYSLAFRELPIILPAPVEKNTRHSFHLYTILIDKNRCGIERDEFINAMTDRKIGIGVHYLSIAEHPFYQNRFGWKPEMYPHAMRIGRQTVSLPLSPKLTNTDVMRVITAVREILNQ